MESEPVYWSPQMPLLADQRRDMPDVEKLQRTFVRYGASASPATVSSAWQKSVSMNASRANRFSHDAAHAADTSAAFSQLPDTISMEIVRAPAEFAVPVKQDKRLKPPFKVRMSMTFTSSMSCPIALTAHAISHSEYERIDTWIPPEIDAQRSFEMIDRPNPTELKGNLTLEWRFDGGGGANASGHAKASSYGDLTTPALDLSGNGEAEGDPLFDMFQSPNMTNNKQHEILLAPQHLPDMSLVKNSDTDYQACLRELLNGGPNNGNMRQHASLSTAYGSRTSRGMPIGEGLMSGGDVQPDSQFVSHDFEFPDLEFARPSRMNKVYIVFACQIAKMDILYTAFAVPTICFCRREQKERAYQRLGIPYRTAATTGAKRQHASAPAPTQPPSQRANLPDLNDGGVLDLNVGNFGLNMPNDRAAAGGNEDFMQYQPFQNELQGLVGGGMTAAEVKDYILDSYYSLGMLRKLTSQDVTALLALSGFPQMGEPDVGDAVVTHEQFQDFKSGWECILTLLQKIHHCWNSDDPFIVCGFEIDHYHAVGALRNQPPGTFLCRFSLSQPGNMVLVCKVPSQSPNADPDGLVHGLLNVIDLQERRVDKWIIDFPGATHLLDVYSSRRVDKRKAFHTNYYRLENLHRSYNGYMPDQPDESSS